MSTDTSHSISTFEDFDLDSALCRGISTAGFIRPRPIQALAIPAVLAGRDVLGLAQTGTGKTAAFGLPVLERLLAERRHGPRALVVAPTRELAAQISAEIRTLGRFTPILVATIIGGVPAQRQRRALAAHPQIIVACPGRLLDLWQQGAIRLDRIETLVLDEADHMFDMGFLPDVRRILSALPAKRQNLLFSATMPREIRDLADRILRNPLVADVAHTQALSTIEHAIYPIENTQKLALLEHILAGDDLTSAIVFTRTKHRARRVARQLERSGHRAVGLQGNMSQGQRERAMEGFRRGRYDVLVATDIAARGIDVQGVSHVVNFDMPNTTDAYTHRIGRTGRAEQEGKAYTFVTSEDFDLVRRVERRLGTPIPRRQISGIGAAEPPPTGSRHRPSGQRAATAGARSRPSHRRRRSGRPGYRKAS